MQETPMSGHAHHSLLMPTLFVPHGAGPCFFMDWNPADTWNRLADFLKGIEASLPATPKAILLISGHWLAPQFSVTSGQRPELIFDYYGFPAHTYELRYPAPGHPELAARVAQLVGQAGLKATQDARRGFDHGVFIPLKLMFAQANVPVVQLSLRADLDASAHLQLGQALTSLREEGVLIVGSGMSFHNMRGYGDPRFGPPSAEFDTWLTAAVEAAPAERLQQLARWAQAPSARLCHPPHAEEHLLPLLVAAGAAGDSAGRKVFSQTLMETTISAFRFG
jgi:aromatic ring-opening dioxygenase catalytic subunit (LigB family)